MVYVTWNSSSQVNNIVHTIWNITSHVIDVVNVNSAYNRHILSEDNIGIISYNQNRRSQGFPFNKHNVYYHRVFHSTNTFQLSLYYVDALSIGTFFFIYYSI